MIRNAEHTAVKSVRNFVADELNMANNPDRRVRTRSGQESGTLVPPYVSEKFVVKRINLADEELILPCNTKLDFTKLTRLAKNEARRQRDIQ